MYFLFYTKSLFDLSNSMVFIYHLLLVLHLHEFIQGALSTSYILKLSAYMGCRACTVLYCLMILHFYGQKTTKLCILGGSN